MNKVLRIVIISIAGLIGLVVVGVLVLGLIEPHKIVVTSTTLIKAPQKAVFEQIQYFKNWPNWSPWQKKNPDMRLTYSGVDGQPGSSYRWEGGDEDKTGAGDMKNLAIDSISMNYEVDFIKPFQSWAKGAITTADSGNMTKVTWSCKVEKAFPWNAVFAMFDMNKQLGPDFDSGLAYMKKYVEGHADTSGIVIKEVDYPGQTFVGIRKVLGWADLGKFFTDSRDYLGKDVSGKINGPAVGLYFQWDTVAKTSDMAAAFPVSDTTSRIKGATFIRIPPGKAYMAIENGYYSASAKYHAALAHHMEVLGQKHSVIIEEYAVSRQQERDSTKWVTNIYYLIQQ